MAASPGVPLLIGVMGPTASGKTELAEQLAEIHNAQLVNADAFQIYRGMDIGTAKPENIDTYRLLDIRNPSEGFGVGEYVVLAQEVLSECWELQKNVVVVGGTGLYIRALFEEYDDMGQAPSVELRESLNARSLESLVEELQIVAPEQAGTLDLRNRVRVQRAIERIHNPKPSVPVHLPPFNKRKFGVIRETEETFERIAQRAEAMMQKGWVREVQTLMSHGYSILDPGFRALGYGAIWKSLSGEIDLQEAQATTIAETRKYAKRQRTWLRSEPSLVILDSGNALEDAMRHLS
jgi:tRNA dimethylallyltransferase